LQVFSSNKNKCSFFFSSSVQFILHLTSLFLNQNNVLPTHNTHNKPKVPIYYFHFPTYFFRNVSTYSGIFQLYFSCLLQLSGLQWPTTTELFTCPLIASISYFSRASPGKLLFECRDGFIDGFSVMKICF